jgi:hypothetical protein
MPKATFSLAGGLSEFEKSGERARDEWWCPVKSAKRDRARKDREFVEDSLKCSGALSEM